VSAVEAQIKASREAHGPPGSSRSLEAFIFLSQGKVEQALKYADEALVVLPAEEIFLRDHAAICAAGCRISLGDVEGGIQLMD
jgi:ATP/maltotriose-dependent transcriptional regulator MalT